MWRSPDGHGISRLESKTAVSSSPPSVLVSHFVAHVWLFIYTPRPVVLHWGDFTSPGISGDVFWLIQQEGGGCTTGIHGQGCWGLSHKAHGSLSHKELSGLKCGQSQGGERRGASQGQQSILFLFPSSGLAGIKYPVAEIESDLLLRGP